MKLSKKSKKNKSKMTDEEFSKKELARQKHMILNSFYGNFGVEFFNSWNEHAKQENSSVKILEINEIHKKE